ncbi:MAG: hypothetical protein J3K34DRAFT_63585 [Monoraphidium minutum]|nr:MAG: hypothetical protein J3K34DRAFT_63585 [Monoraphidium minutum]
MLRLRNFQQQALGRTPLRYQFEVVPHGVDGVPAGVEAVSIVWEKGSKICYTCPAPVDPATRAARFHEVMRQTATLYREEHAFMPKEFAFKLQALGGGKRRTIARAALDLAPYAGHGAHPESQCIDVALDVPGCTLQLSVRAVWLQHVAVGGSTGGASSVGGGGQAATEGSSVHSGYDGCGVASGSGAPSLGAASVSLDDGSDDESSAGGRPGAPGHGCASGGGDYHSSVAFMDVLLGLQSGDGGRPRSVGAPASPAASPLTSSSCGPGAGGHLQGGGGCGDTGRAPGHNRSSSAPAVLPQDGGGSGMAGAATAGSQRQSSAAGAPLAGRARPPLTRIGSHGGSFSGPGREGLATVPSMGDADADAAIAAAAAAAGAAGMASRSPFAPDAAAGSGGGPPVPRAASGSLPQWMWPQGRGAVRGVSTEELMRAIAGTSDAAELQRLARGLLAERNDFRATAERWERAAHALEAQVADARANGAGLSERVHVLERQVSLLREDGLVERLVAAKLTAAERDLEASELRGSLQQERERSRQLASQLAVLQGRHDALAARAGGGAGYGAGPHAVGAAAAQPATLYAAATPALQQQLQRQQAKQQLAAAQRRRVDSDDEDGSDQDGIGVRVSSMLAQRGLRTHSAHGTQP